MQTLVTDPAQCLAELRRSNLMLCHYLESCEKRNLLSEAEKNAVFNTIGQIGYVDAALALALGVVSETDVPDFETLTENAGRLSRMVQDLVSTDLSLH